METLRRNLFARAKVSRSGSSNEALQFSQFFFERESRRTDKRKRITTTHRSWRLLDLEMDKTLQTYIGTNLLLAPIPRHRINRLALTGDNPLRLSSESTNR